MENITFDMLTNGGSFAVLVYVLYWLLTRFSKQMDEHKDLILSLKETMESNKALVERLIEKLLQSK